MPIPFEELAGSPTLRIVEGRLTGSRRFKVTWANRLSFAEELLGGYRLVGGALSYQPPAYLPEAPQAVVREVEIEPFPADAASGPPASLLAPENTYPFATVVATYGIPDYNKQRNDLPGVPAGTLLSFESDMGGEYVNIPGRTWVWTGSDTNVPPDVNPGVLVPTEDIRLSWERVPAPPWNAMRDARGLVNSQAFLNHPPGTVLFMGARTAREFQVQGDALWRIVYHFKVREVPSTEDEDQRFGWNHFYRDVTSGERWQTIEVKGGASKNKFPYAATTLAALFSFEP